MTAASRTAKRPNGFSHTRWSTDDRERDQPRRLKSLASEMLFKERYSTWRSPSKILELLHILAGSDDGDAMIMDSFNSSGQNRASAHSSIHHRDAREGNCELGYGAIT